MSGAEDTRAGTALLTASALEKHFPVRRVLLQRQVGAVRAVDGLDFEVLRGEMLSLVGESGCGKTTTGRLITRLLEPTGGRVEFEGRDITHRSARALRPLRRDIAMVFQDPYSALNPRHTIVAAPFRIGHRALRRLLSAVPRPDPRRRGRRDRILLTGDVPSPLDPPPACRFHTRCWQAQEVCRTEEPPPAELAAGHRVACHFPENSSA